jgi:hypothetical protein
MVAPNKNVVTLHRTTFSAERNSTSAAPRWAFFEVIQQFTAEMSRRFARVAKMQARSHRGDKGNGERFKAGYEDRGDD